MKSILLLVALTLLFSGDISAQSSQPDPATITCSSHVPAVRYFCWQYRSKQEAAWSQRQKLPTDAAEFTLRLDKFDKDKVIVGLTVTINGVRHNGTLYVAIDHRHLTAAAARVTEATGATLDLWSKGGKK